MADRLSLRASVGSTEANSSQPTSVSSDRRAYEAADQYLRAVFLIPDLS
jgi:hypothetical protein